MRAAWYSRFGPAEEVLEVGELPDPQPGPGEVRVRIVASGINPSDVKLRAGQSRPLAAERVIPHSDGAGTIDRVGEGVDALNVGRGVWTFNAAYKRAGGTAAQYVVLPLHLTAPLPDGVSFQTGACLGVPAMTAHRCVFAAGPVAGRTVLVTGGGGVVGRMAVQMARWAGARVIATAGSAESLEHARTGGAHEVVDYREAQAYERIAALAGPEGVDLIVEVDLAANAQRSTAVLCQGGTVASYASPSDREPRIPFYAWAGRNVTLACVLVYEMTAAQRERAVQDIVEWCRSPHGGIAIARTLPLDDIVQAHRLVEADRKTGQVVLEMS
jgi:NADPH2:quinone reductase